MASLEQLQMLNDGDSSTSSSDEEDDVGNTSLPASNDENTSEAPATNVGPIVGNPKKRIKLSLGGAFKATMVSSSSEPKKQGQQNQPKKTTAAASEIRNKPKITLKAPNSASPTNKSNSSNNKKTLDAQTKPPSSKVSPKVESYRAAPNKSHSKAKPAAVTPSASGVKSKPKETKKRQLPKSPSPTPSTTAGGGNSAAPTKKRSSMRSIRITPMSSPGLLLGSNVKGGSTGGANETSNASSPNNAFAQTMATVGYSAEARTNYPHRGSSMELTVDDMFDSDVKFCLRFPKLVPAHLISTTTTKATTKAEPSALPATQESKPQSSPTKDQAGEIKNLQPISTLMERLTKAFQKPHSVSNKGNPPSTSSSLFADASSTTARKRYSKIPQYSDIVPISLNLDYPDAYVEKRLEYVKKVDQREKAIVDLQGKQDGLHTGPDAKARNVVPPIPKPPEVPTRDDLQMITNVEDVFGSDDQQLRSHPLYLPKNQELVDHLDKRCFHATEGRYFGLSSNAIADPCFFGPNAPGIGGLNLSSSTGLATASTSAGGGAGALGSPLFTMPAQPSTAPAAGTKTTLA